MKGHVLWFAVGALFGGRAVRAYDWRTEWHIPARLPEVYRALTSRGAPVVV